MNNIQKIQKGQELLQELITKSWNNATFKEQLINSPKVTIENLTGVKSTLSNNTKIVVEDQTDTSIIYLNIPKKVNMDDLELSDEELEGVSGGDFLLGVAGSLVACAIWEIGGGFYQAYKDFN